MAPRNCMGCISECDVEEKVEPEILIDTLLPDDTE